MNPVIVIPLLIAIAVIIYFALPDNAEQAERDDDDIY